MPATPVSPAGGDPLLKLKWLVGSRLMLASVLLGSAVVLDWHERLPFGTAPLYGLLALTFGLSLAYALLLRSQRGLRLQTYAQLGTDLLLVSLLVHFTGGVDSLLPFMYIFVVFAAAHTLERRASLTVACLCGGAYGLLVLAEWSRLVAPVEFAGGLAPLRSAGYAIYQILIHGVAFLAVAILSSHLADRLRQAGREIERRGLDLRNLQTLHEAIVTNIASGLLTLDLAGRVVAFNRAAEGITGYPFAELQDQPWQATPFAAFGPLAAYGADPAAPLDPPSGEFTLVRRDGRPIPLGISCSRLQGADGAPAGLVAIFQDLTEQKQVEEQLRRADRLAALGRLSASIAHEVRNPLAAISGSTEMLRQELELAGPQRELLDIVLRETHRLKLVTGQFLEFSKPQALLCRPCPVRPLILDTLQLLERSSERHPALTWSLEEGEPDLRVLADPDQLRQVFWNLCLNALQAMPGGGALTVAIRPGRPPGGPGGPEAAPDPAAESWVEIAFQDTGRGIPQEALERVFDPFFTTRPSGTGLGLSIARQLLQSMGGRIAADSRPEGGTTLTCWLRRDPVLVPAGGGRGGSA